jgi:hypothetical protein
MEKIIWRRQRGLKKTENIVPSVTLIEVVNELGKLSNPERRMNSTATRLERGMSEL